MKRVDTVDEWCDEATSKITPGCECGMCVMVKSLANALKDLNYRFREEMQNREGEDSYWENEGEVRKNFQRSK